MCIGRIRVIGVMLWSVRSGGGVMCVGVLEREERIQSEYGEYAQIQPMGTITSD